jgi:3-deoxy-D-manno-octulosonate 8-phosphate phosphatase (KDO 8-P phosphatase)
MTAEGRARKVALILMDADGTLTDGSLVVTPDGEELKTYHVRDGLGILLARLGGLDLGIITGKTSKGLEKRAARLRIIELHQGALDKLHVLEGILERRGLAPEAVAYIGDDIGDLAVMKTVGLAAAVADAVPEVKEHCHYVCRTPGGRGAVREFIEFILKAQGKWEDVTARVQEVKGAGL